MTKQKQILEGLTYALQGLNSRIQANLLTEIVDCLPQELKEEVLRKALVATKSIRDEGDYLDALKSLAHKLPPDLLPEAFAIGKVMRSSRLACAQAAKVLTPLLPPDLLLEALDIARNPNLDSEYTIDEYTIALALSTLADELPEELRTEVALEALAAAESIPFGDDSGNLYHRSSAITANVYRSGALTAVVDIVPKALRAEVLHKALDSARSVEAEWARSMSLVNLVSKLPEALQAAVLQEALDAVRDEKVDRAIAIALMVLIPKLPLDLLPEALTIAREFKTEYDRAMALIAITARLPEMLPETFALVKSIKHKDNRFSHSRSRVLALTAISPYLSSKLMPIYLPELESKYRALTAISPYLSSELLPEALDIAKEIPLRWDRIPVLIALASRMSKMPKEELLPLWQTTRHWLSQQSGQELANHVLALTPAIYAIGGQEAVVEALMEIQNVERWQP